jgi:hypothetical protein
MSGVAVEGETGVFTVAGKRVFPVVLSNGPPLESTAPSGRNGLAEVAAAGVTMLRTGRADWTAAQVDGQIAAERNLLDAAAAHGLSCWTWLGKLPNLPAASGSPGERLLVTVVDALKEHPALGAWKGVDEPLIAGIPAAGLVRAHERLRALDPAHPVVLIQAPRGTAARLRPYSRAADIVGSDIYPVSYPPGAHVGRRNADIGVVGDITRKMVSAASGKPVWTTLQIAWSGVLPPKHVPRFPGLLEQRFMAYQAIIAGARGLAFFGGHLKAPMRPADARSGWNWTFWRDVLGPLVSELSSTALAPALTAGDGVRLIASATEIEHTTRQDSNFLYLLAVRRGTTTTQVTFSGLPAAIGGGEVLFEYANDHFRDVTVRRGRFQDWLGPHDARIYRFPHKP